MSRNEETTPSVKYTATPPQRGIKETPPVSPSRRGINTGMSAKQVAYAKSLRQQIMITAKNKHGWDSDEFHDVLDSWGYGRSLRQLSIQALQNVLGIVKGEYSPEAPDEMQRQLEKYSIGCFDKQGRYAWYLMKVAGWDWFRVQKYMIRRYHKLHWNGLKEDEKRGVISMLRKYAKEDKNERKV